MGVYIKHWSLADWKELLKWAKIGANNAMIGEFTEVEELPPHGRLIDADALKEKWLVAENRMGADKVLHLPLKDYISDGCVYDLEQMPTIIEAEEVVR